LVLRDQLLLLPVLVKVLVHPVTVPSKFSAAKDGRMVKPLLRTPAWDDGLVTITFQFPEALVGKVATPLRLVPPKIWILVATTSAKPLRVKRRPALVAKRVPETSKL